jgi:hypothetical protein
MKSAQSQAKNLSSTMLRIEKSFCNSSAKKRMLRAKTSRTSTQPPIAPRGIKSKFSVPQAKS